jgi:hypothetical protein
MIFQSVNPIGHSRQKKTPAFKSPKTLGSFLHLNNQLHTHSHSLSLSLSLSLSKYTLSRLGSFLPPTTSFPSLFCFSFRVSFNFLFRIYSTDRPRSIKQFKQFLLVVPHLLSIHQIFSLRRKGKEGSLEQVHPTSSGMRNLYNQCTVFTQIHSAKLNLKKIT